MLYPKPSCSCCQGHITAFCVCVGLFQVCAGHPWNTWELSHHLGCKWMSYTYFISLNSDFEEVKLPKPKANAPRAQAVITCRGDSGHEECIGMQGVTPQIFLLPPDWIENCLNVGKQGRKKQPWESLDVEHLGWISVFCLVTVLVWDERNFRAFASCPKATCTPRRKHILSCC